MLSVQRGRGRVALTYDSDRPLILLYKGRGWVFKDLYALLYLHLQMRDDSA